MPSSPESYLIYDLEVAWSLAAVSAYFVMFAFYLHLLRTRRLAKHRFLNIATIALFILCTIHCALVLAATILGTRLEMGAVFGSERSFTNVTLAAEAVYITTNFPSWSHLVTRAGSSASDGRKGSNQVPHQFEADNYALTDLGDHGRDRIGTGIAPTIIAVRVGLGYSVESVDSFIAPTPRTRAVSQFPAARHVESADEILYIRPLSEKVETV
ncbi:hypothetical protein B0H14DRAFT_2602086 [Mycena olivaceomarginata]|nr:hypothetical protein B0H14DRAFT_2602086 [Mycena olivaceomarginata]